MDCCAKEDTCMSEQKQSLLVQMMNEEIGEVLFVEVGGDLFSTRPLSPQELRVFTRIFLTSGIAPEDIITFNGGAS